MSSFQDAAQTAGGAGGAGQLPGQTTVRPPNAAGVDSLRLALGQAFEGFGKELQKPKPDPVQMTRFKSMIVQVQNVLQAPTTSDGGTDLSPDVGRPRPVSGTVDSVTGINPAELVRRAGRT